MRDVGPYHLKSDLLLPHYFKPETKTRLVVTCTAPVQLKRVYICKQVMKGLLVFILVPECFVYPLCDGFAVDDQTFCDWWLETDEDFINIDFINSTNIAFLCSTENRANNTRVRGLMPNPGITYFFENFP